MWKVRESQQVPIDETFLQRNSLQGKWYPPLQPQLMLTWHQGVRSRSDHHGLRRGEVWAFCEVPDGSSDHETVGGEELHQQKP